MVLWLNEAPVLPALIRVRSFIGFLLSGSRPRLLKFRFAVFNS
jgi:hypothetical protein